MNIREAQAPINGAVDSGQLVLVTLDRLRLPKESNILIGSGNLALRGLITRPVGDADLLTDYETVQEIANMPGGFIDEYYDESDGAESITAHLHSPDLPLPVSATVSLGRPHYPLDFYELQYTGLIEGVWGIQCLTLDEVIISKAALGRPKDIEDLDVVSQSLAKIAATLELA